MAGPTTPVVETGKAVGFWVGRRGLKPPLGTLAELDFVQPAVRIAAADQFVVGAGVDDAALLHDYDSIGQGQRRQTVGDDDRRAVAGEMFQHSVDQLFALQIDLAGGFVQDQDRRIAQDGPGQAMRWRWPPEACLPGPDLACRSRVPTATR